MYAYLYGHKDIEKMIMPEDECQEFMADSTRHVMKDPLTEWAAIIYRHRDGRVLVFDVFHDKMPPP